MEIVELQDSEKNLSFIFNLIKRSQVRPFRVLSEGQLRCFGLAILMSVTKNLILTL